MTEMTINKLPSKTWYWLKVNETKLPWDFEHTTELPEENISVGQEETARFSITAVSYTHLDVYKRQGLCKADEELRT